MVKLSKVKQGLCFISRDLWSGFLCRLRQQKAGPRLRTLRLNTCCIVHDLRKVSNMLMQNAFQIFV